MRPATEAGTVADKESSDHHHEGHERDPERHHVEMREWHVFRAGLNGQEEVSECCERGGGEHEEDHDRAMHGHELQVVLGRHDVAGRAAAGEKVKAWNRETAPAEVETHEPGQEHSHYGGDQGQGVVLLSDDFVVKAEDMLANEACGGSVRHCVSRHVVHCAHLKRDVLSGCCRG